MGRDFRMMLKTTDELNAGEGKASSVTFPYLVTDYSRDGVPFLQIGNTIADGVETSRDSVVRFWKTFHDQKDYESRILELETKVEKYDELARENARLTKLLEFKSSLEYKTIGARVIGWDNNPWKKTLIHSLRSKLLKLLIN